MSIEEKLDILIEEIRMLRSEMTRGKEPKPAINRYTAFSDVAINITEDMLSGLQGIMTAREVCLAVGVEYSKSSTSLIGSRLNRMGVKRKRTKATRLFDFGGEDMASLGEAVSVVRSKISQMHGKKTIQDVVSFLGVEQNTENLVLYSKALRHIGVRQSSTTGEFFFGV